jgi:hypothetical protein
MEDLRPEEPLEYHDEHGRIRPGLLRGWGMSWWWHEQGFDPREARSLTIDERFELMNRYWKAVGQGWEPPVPREQWVGPHHPWEAGDT